MAMSRKQYVAVANTIARHAQLHADNDSPSMYWAVEQLAHDLARDFKADNSNFDTGRFLDTCKVGLKGVNA